MKNTPASRARCANVSPGNFRCALDYGHGGGEHSAGPGMGAWKAEGVSDAAEQAKQDAAAEAMTQGDALDIAVKTLRAKARSFAMLSLQAENYSAKTREEYRAAADRFAEAASLLTRVPGYVFGPRATEAEGLA